MHCVHKMRSRCKNILATFRMRSRSAPKVRGGVHRSRNSDRRCFCTNMPTHYRLSQCLLQFDRLTLSIFQKMNRITEVYLSKIEDLFLLSKNVTQSSLYCVCAVEVRIKWTHHSSNGSWHQVSRFEISLIWWPSSATILVFPLVLLPHIFVLQHDVQWNEPASDTYIEFHK